MDASADDTELQDALQAVAMFNEARRTWSQAQQATATLKRDRGFGQFSSAGKGKGKCFQCGGDHFVRDCPDHLHPGARKGFGKHLSPAELESFLLKGKGCGKGKSKGLHAVSWDDSWFSPMGDSFDGYAMYKGSGKFGKGFNKGKGKPSMNTYNMDFSYMPSYMLELQPLELFSTSQQSSSTSSPKAVPVGFGMLDSGATASAALVV